MYYLNVRVGFLFVKEILPSVWKPTHVNREKLIYWQLFLLFIKNFGLATF